MKYIIFKNHISTFYKNPKLSTLKVIETNLMIEERFWKLWKINIFNNTTKYKDDNYKFMCAKSKFHNTFK